MGVPHLRVPFRIERSGNAQLVEQDSSDEIVQSVRVLLSTLVGQRLEVPGYGIPDQAFLADSSLSTAVLSSQVKKWEPRADVRIKESIDRSNSGIRRVLVEVATSDDSNSESTSGGRQMTDPLTGKTWTELGFLTWDQAGQLTWAAA